MREEILRAASGASDAGDPLFADVILLANFATDATDVKGHSVTVSGPTFSGGTIVLDGVNDYFEYTGFGAVTNDICIEMTSTFPLWNGELITVMCENRQAVDAGGIVIYAAAPNSIFVNAGGINQINIAKTFITQGVECHIALQTERVDANNMRWTLYIDGTRVSTVVFASFSTSRQIDDRVRFGVNNGGIYPSQHTLNALRITEGVRYPNAATITVPTLPYLEA